MAQALSRAMRPFSSGILATVLRMAEGAALATILRGLEALGPRRASDLGGCIARVLGPLLPASRVADANLRRALPRLDGRERACIVRAVWENLGRTCAELPHLATLRRTGSGSGWELGGGEHIARHRETGAPAMFFSGHFGNWEMVLPIASQLGLSVCGIYRPPSSRRVALLLDRLRRRALGPGVSMFPKGARGARLALRHLQQGGSLGLLADQKMNDGIDVPFFGQPAMTAPALAQLALRFGLPIVPVRVVRLGAARFRMVCEAPLEVPLTGRRDADVRAITVAVNATLERWIREDPAAWLWLHRRWPEPQPGAPASELADPGEAVPA